MKKWILFIVLCVICNTSFCQKFTLKINSPELSCDSIYLQQFNTIEKTHTVAAISNSDKLVIKLKKALPAGFYRISADTNRLFDLLISDENNENFSVDIDANRHIAFANNEENNNYITFLQRTLATKQKIDSLNKIFEKAQKNESQQALQMLAQQLMQQTETLLSADEAYKFRVMAENKGTLLAAIASFSRETKPISQARFQNKQEFLQYYSNQIFEHFNFDDPRMATTPMLTEKLKEWCTLIFDMSITNGSKNVDKLLSKAQAAKENYEAIFDKLEKFFGDFHSDYWTEEIYLSMLQNAIHYNELSTYKHNRYETLYDLYNRNLAGTPAADFKIEWPDGTKSSLYEVESEYLILFFQNPDCPTCTELRKLMAENKDLNQAIDSGRIKVLTIYFNKDEKMWRNYLEKKANPRYLHGWEYEQKILNDNLYYLPNIPYLFLLDKDKKVIKKELMKNEITYYLNLLKLL